MSAISLKDNHVKTVATDALAPCRQDISINGIDTM